MMDDRELTRLLNAAARGQPGAAEQLLPLVYDQLRAMARRRVQGDGATIEPTSLVHEAWLRLAGGSDPGWHHRGHFFGAAAVAMRRVLVELARARKAKKRAGARVDCDPEELPIGLPDPDTLLDLDAALQQLAIERPREARVVELRYFGGLEMAEIATTLGVSLGTVERDWRIARARLQRWLGADT